MPFSDAYLDILREYSRDEAAFQRLVALIEPGFNDPTEQPLSISADAISTDLLEPDIALAHFFAVALDLWCIADTDGYFLKLNKIWETTLGYPLDELIGRRFLDFIHPDDLQLTIDAISMLSDQHPILNFTNRYRCKDGNYRYIEWRSQPQGKLIYAAARDVTERKQLELYQSRLTAIIQSSREAIVSRNLEGVITSWNRGAEAIYGYTEAEAMGHKMLEIVAADQADSVFSNVERIKRGEHIERFLCPFVHKDGSQRIVSMSISPLFDIDGKIVGGAAIGQDVTDRTKMEAYQGQLSAIVESSGDGIIGRTLQGIITSWNPGAEAIYGYTAQEMIGKSMAILAPPDRIHELEINLEKVKRSEYVERYETVRLHKDGTRVNVALTISPIKDRAGEIIGISTINQNISELKKIQDVLTESEARYRAIVTTMTEGIVLQASDGSIQTCNSAAERILGLTAAQMGGLTSLDPKWRTVHEDFTLFPGETHPAMVALRTGQSVANVVMGVYKPDDTLSWILINSQPLFRTKEEQPYATVTSFADITQVRKMELTLQQNLERMQNIFETIEDVIWSIQLPSFQMTYINPVCSRIFGYPVEAFYEHPTLPTRLIHPEDLARVQASQTMILEQGKADVTYRIVRPDGEIRYVHNRSWLARNIEGQPLRIEGIVSDVTGQKIIEEQALQLQMQHERGKLLSDFITNTSHELRAPLTIISTGIYLMIRSDDPAKRQAKGAQLEQQVKFLNMMIQQLHEMAKLNNLTHLDLKPTPLRELVSEFMTGYVPRNKTITVTTALDPHIPIIMGNVDYLGLALGHILDNAVRFSIDDNTVSVQIRVNDQEVILLVEDHGIGIPTEHLEHIFEHFYKVNAARTPDDYGVGMGLALVKRIMELHHGRVTVQSIVDHGTTICLYFPV